MRVEHWDQIVAAGKQRHGVVDMATLDRIGIPPTSRRRLLAAHRLERAGRRSFVLAGAPDTWGNGLRSVWRNWVRVR